MIHIDWNLKPTDLKSKLERFWKLSAEKIMQIEKQYDPAKGSPVFTVEGRYTSRGWTEWTQGFQYGSALLQYEATGEKRFLDIGREKTVSIMAPHVSHTGVHDHGFNNVSTYGNLLRLMKEGTVSHDAWEERFYALALKISGAVQASRWTVLRDGGFIHSFNGPHSLFVDTIRSCRALALSHSLGHVLHGENDVRISLLARLIDHCRATAKFSIYYGEGRDSYDVRGRTAHESVFNTKDGNYRCPNSQQGYSPFSTWTRGLAWAMCGFAEELEYLSVLPDPELKPFGGRAEIETWMLKAARATCDFYIQYTPTDGIPLWDTGAPDLHRLGDFLNRPSDPFNGIEPVDSSAAAIGSQGLLRLGHCLRKKGETESGTQYIQAGLTVINRLLEEPYLSTNPDHQGLILHSVYHRPNGWDHVPKRSNIPNGESSMWGDYHAREIALYVMRMTEKKSYHAFFNGVA